MTFVNQPTADNPHPDRRPEFLRLGFTVWGTGGGCEAWGLNLPNGSHIMVTDTGGAYLPDGGATLVGLYANDEDFVGLCREFPTTDEALTYLRRNYSK